MPIRICPHCKQRYTVGFDTTDYVHECNSGNAATDQEDVLVIGDWEDYSGSGTKAPQTVLMQGITNQLFGTRAGIEGKDKNAETRRGKTAATHRQRQKLTFIEVKGVQAE